MFKKIKYKIIGIICILIFLSAMIPINATDTLTGTNIIKKTLEERIVEPINASQINGSQPLEQYFLNKKANQSIFMITKFIEDFDNQQTVLPEGVDSYEFMNAYMANDTSKKFNILGMDFTANDAVKNIPILKDYPATMFRFIDYYVTLNEREQIDYVWRNYPQFESIEKNLETYSNDKLSYVLEHAELNCTDLIDNVPKSKVALDKWDSYKQYAKDALGFYARDIQNEGIYYDLYVAPKENPVMDLSRILDVITGLNGTLYELDDTRYEMAQGGFSMQATGGFLIMLGTTMITGSAVADLKGPKTLAIEAEAPKPIINEEIETLLITDENGHPLPDSFSDETVLAARENAENLKGRPLNSIDGLTRNQRARIVYHALKNGEMEPFRVSLVDEIEYSTVGCKIQIEGQNVNVMFRIEKIEAGTEVIGYKVYENMLKWGNGIFFQTYPGIPGNIRFNGFFANHIINSPPPSNIFGARATPTGFEEYSTPLENLTNITIFKNLDDDGMIKFFTVDSINNSYDTYGIVKTEVENGHVYDFTGLNKSSIVTVYGFTNQSQPITEGFTPRNLPKWADITKDVGVTVGGITLLIIICKYIPWGNNIIYLIGSIILAIGIVIEVLGCYMVDCANAFSETLEIMSNAYNSFINLYNNLIYDIVG